MSLLDNLTTGGVFGFAQSVIERIWPDPAERDKAKLALLEAQQRGELAELDAEVKLLLGQIETNKVEAASSSVFVAGWRPFVGWVCGASLAYQYIAYPLILWGSTICGADIGKLPSLDYAGLSTILMGMLGLAGIRSFEKVKGVAR